MKTDMDPIGRAQWSSQIAFLIVAVGSSVGLGNLWRFSGELGTNGGAAFLMIYIICIVFVGVPVLMSELIMGRAGNAASAIESSNDLATRSGVSKKWTLGTWFGVTASFLILSFYCVVAAWVMNYLVRFLKNAFTGLPAETIAEQFPQMLESPLTVLPYFLIFAGLTIWLVARGVNKGIEMAARLLMPMFFILLAGLALYALISGLKDGGTREALTFMFTPDFSKINAEVAVSALGQACFSIGIGTGTMITYGSYIPRSVSIPKAVFTISIADTL